MKDSEKKKKTTTTPAADRGDKTRSAADRGDAARSVANSDAGNKADARTDHPVFGNQGAVGKKVEKRFNHLVGLPHIEAGKTTYFLTFAARPGMFFDRTERALVLESIIKESKVIWTISPHVHAA